MKPELKQHLDSLADCARQNLEEYGHLVPVAFIYHHNTQNVIPLSFADNEEKEAMAVMLRTMARQLDAQAVIMIHEAWQRTVPDAKSLDDWDGVQPSQHPDRTEIVGMFIETMDGSWMGTAPITRDAAGKPTFGAMEYKPFGERDPRERFQFL